MRKAEPLSKISNLDVTDDSLDEKYKEFKEAINTGAFSDEYNLPSADVEKLHSDDVTAMIPQLLDMMFDDGNIISPNTDMKEVNDLFSKLYQQYLGRKLCQAEKSVLSTAVKIMIWKIYGKTFHRICQYRYAYASRTAERQQLYQKRNAEEANSIPAKYIVGYHDIPDKDLTVYPLVSTSIAAKDVDYDLIVYDTYDYLVAMDRSNLRDMARFVGNDPLHKVSLLMSYTSTPHDVADPWFTGNFEDTWRDVLAGCTALLERLCQ